MKVPASGIFQPPSAEPIVFRGKGKRQQDDTFKPRLDASKMPGHWLLARLGKRVLRPGGLETTRAMLENLHVSPQDRVVEFAPGLGLTASMVLDKKPGSYIGIERDQDAIALLRRKLGNSAGVSFQQGAAQKAELPDSSATVVYGEAMLTMQTDKAKRDIVREAFRLLEPGGRYGIHELALELDKNSQAMQREIAQALSSSIHVNAQPLTVEEWKNLLKGEGFNIIEESTYIAPMHLLAPKRMLQDEGVLGTLKIMGNLLRDSAARKRVLEMRSVFTRYQSQLRGISLVAVKPPIPEAS